MRCSPRLQTCVVKLVLFLFLISFGGVLDKERAQKIALEKLREEFGERVKVDRISLILSRPVEYRKLERVELSVREGFPRGYVHLYLSTNKGMRRVTLLLDLRWRCEVLIVTENIGRGERIYPWQVSLRREYLSRCPRQGIEDPEELVNYVALKNIPRGEPLRMGYLKKEPLVRRGEVVSIIFRRGSIEISFTGEALDNGFLGDTVRVRSANTGKILRGRVVSEGSVLVR